MSAVKAKAGHDYDQGYWKPGVGLNAFFNDMLSITYFIAFHILGTPNWWWDSESSKSLTSRSALDTRQSHLPLKDCSQFAVVDGSVEGNMRANWREYFNSNFQLSDNNCANGEW